MPVLRFLENKYIRFIENPQELGSKYMVGSQSDNSHNSALCEIKLRTLKLTVYRVSKLSYTAPHMRNEL